MEWYDGTVTEALSLYQEKNGILVVYIHHKEGFTYIFVLYMHIQINQRFPGF